MSWYLFAVVSVLEQRFDTAATIFSSSQEGNRPRKRVDENVASRVGGPSDECRDIQGRGTTPVGSGRDILEVGLGFRQLRLSFRRDRRKDIEIGANHWKKSGESAIRFC